MAIVPLVPLGFGLWALISSSYKVTDRLSTVQFGDKFNFIRISTVLINKKRDKTKRKGVFIYANKMEGGRLYMKDFTIPLSEQDIDETLEATRNGGPIDVTWGHKPEVGFFLRKDGGDGMITFRRDWFFKSYFSAETKSGTVSGIGKAFQVLDETDAASSLEV